LTVTVTLVRDRPGHRRAIGGGLLEPLFVAPETDVDRERDHTEQRDHTESDQRQHLASLCLPSGRVLHTKNPPRRVRVTLVAVRHIRLKAATTVFVKHLTDLKLAGSHCRFLCDLGTARGRTESDFCFR
jgi:hypothetical protein